LDGRLSNRDGLLHLRHIRHLTVFVRVFTTDFAVTDFVGQHWVVAGAGTTELIARYQVPNVDQQEGSTEYGEDDGKEGQETVHDGLLWWGKDNTFGGVMVVLRLSS
jgi:hypothetical protein